MPWRSKPAKLLPTMKKRIGEIFRVFHGASDILPDGKLDYSEDVEGNHHDWLSSRHQYLEV